MVLSKVEHSPSESQIRERAAVIRAEWDPDTLAKRCAKHKPDPYSIPTARLAIEQFPKNHT